MRDRESLLFTDHARRRSQQRGKRREALVLIYRHGDLERRAGRGRVAVRLSRAACAGLLAGGLSKTQVERAARAELVVSELDGAVITVLDSEE